MLHRLRLGLQEPNLGTKVGSNDGGEVEVDATFVGGKLKNMHKDRRAGWESKRAGAVGKAVVMGILDRDMRKVRAKVVPGVKRDTLQAEVLSNLVRPANEGRLLLRSNQEWALDFSSAC